MDRMLLFGMIGLPKNMLEFAIPTSKKRFSTTDDLQDYHGLNMLHHACREGHIQMGSHRTLAADNDSRSLEIADILLQAGANPNIPSYTGNTCLHNAGRSNHPRLVQKLLQYGALPNVSDVEGITVLESAAVLGADVKAVELLIDAGADTSVWCQDKRSPISNAIVRKDFDMFKILLRGISDINMIDGNGVGILHHQLILERPEWLACLLERPDPTMEEGCGDRGPLHLAVKRNCPAIVRMLMEHPLPPDPNYVPENGVHVLIQAVQPGNAGARPEAQAYLFMDIPLHQACQKANLEAVKVLHAAAPELINSQDFFGHTPLIDACREGAVAVVEFLLHNGADIGQRDHLGHSCISRVVDQEPGIALRLIRLLLNHGLGINDVVACDGFTVLAEACVAQNMPLVEYLLEKGADPIRCQRGPDGTSWRTAVHLVMQRRKPKALDVLLERQDVRDHMKALDWAGRTVIHCSLRHPTTQLMVSKLYWASGAVEASDFFTDLINLQAQYVGLIAQFMRPS
ncbi:Serine/threonine-protein phosphatase 6 regulatory ankyrin repeat like [Verticillium longisporum]|nr:Serine/threonine-protein phosphatase 6 regulatory ankyrin repeat like [Verticillium longisporum]